MTKQDYLIKHPGAELTMAPITGGADIQLHDYMESLCNSLSTGGIEDAVVFSFSHCVILIKWTDTESTMRILHGTLHPRDREELMHRMAGYKDAIDDIADEFEDFTVDYFVTERGNVFMPDWYESYAQLHNDGYIRCIYEHVNWGIGSDLKAIQDYLEESNEDPDCQTVCTTQQTDEHDVKFEWWYKKD